MSSVLTRIKLPPVQVAAGTEVFDLVGNTPLIPLRQVASSVLPVEVYAKAEWFNPSGSVKDRPAREIILQIRLTRDEHKALKRAANGDVSKWSRAVLLRAAARS